MGPAFVVSAVYGSFAHFLNQRKDEEALFFYQQSLLCYLEHSACKAATGLMIVQRNCYRGVP